MYFINPEFIAHLLWSIPLALLIIFIANIKRSKIISSFISNNMLSILSNLNPWSRIRRNFCLLGAWSLLFIAYAKPWFGEKIADTAIASRDIIICLDTSKSMLARDIVPSRLQHAKFWIKQLVEQFPGDRFALINFAGEAILECPLTSSADNFLDYLNNTDTNSIPLGGTNIESALTVAIDAFKACESNNRAIILISDGDELQGNTHSILQNLLEKNIPVFSVGIGDPSQPGIIEIGDGKVLRDNNNQPVISKLNEKGLANFAEKTKGIYVRSTTLDAMIKPIASRIDSLEPYAETSTKESLRINRFYIPLSVALILLLLRFITSERIRKRNVLLIVCFLSLHSIAESTPENLIPTEINSNINTTNNNINLDEIAKIQEQISSYNGDQTNLDYLHFLLGATYQKSGNYDEAIASYDKISPNASHKIISSLLANRASIKVNN
ncbi:MAG: VWA domain-containing protein, partial [Lentisphaeria bacterium]